jgi:hypothetical protein
LVGKRKQFVVVKIHSKRVGKETFPHFSPHTKSRVSVMLAEPEVVEVKRNPDQLWLVMGIVTYSRIALLESFRNSQSYWITTKL